MTPEQLFLIVTIISLAYGIESIFGFGGTILALTGLGFFFDIKDMIVLTTITAFLSSLMIFWPHRRELDREVFKKSVIFLVPGIILGSLVLKYFSSDIILKIFGGFLLIYAIYSLFIKNLHLPKKLRSMIHFVAGVIGGVFGTAGPLIVIAIRDSIRNKLQLKVTLAALFIVVHLLRAPMYWGQGILDPVEILSYIWMVIPMFFTIWLGHHVHSKISEKTFTHGVSILLGLAGVSFLI
jgi:uncharacterized protein